MILNFHAWCYIGLDRAWTFQYPVQPLCHDDCAGTHDFNLEKRKGTQRQIPSEVWPQFGLSTSPGGVQIPTDVCSVRVVFHSHRSLHRTDSLAEDWALPAPVDFFTLCPLGYHLATLRVHSVASCCGLVWQETQGCCKGSHQRLAELLYAPNSTVDMINSFSSVVNDSSIFHGVSRHKETLLNSKLLTPIIICIKRKCERQSTLFCVHLSLPHLKTKNINALVCALLIWTPRLSSVLKNIEIYWLSYRNNWRIFKSV